MPPKEATEVKQGTDILYSSKRGGVDYTDGVVFNGSCLFKASSDKDTYTSRNPLMEDGVFAVKKPLNQGNIFYDLVTRYNKQKGGSTLTIADLDKKGNLKFSILGDSPVYLTVADKHGKEHVIKLSADMQAQVRPFQRDENYDFGVESPKDRYSNYGLRIVNDKNQVQGLATSGAIGDSDIPNKLAVPEFYNFSKGANYTKVLNEYLTTIGVEGDINDLLKRGAAKVVVASDGLDAAKIDNQSVHGHELSFTGAPLSDKSLTTPRPEPLPEGEIIFKVCEKEKKVPPSDNPILYIANADKIPITKQVTDLMLKSQDDVVVSRLPKGQTVAVVDGHDLDHMGRVSSFIILYLKAEYEQYIDATRAATFSDNGTEAANEAFTTQAQKRFNDAKLETKRTTLNLDKWLREVNYVDALMLKNHPALVKEWELYSTALLADAFKTSSHVSYKKAADDFLKIKKEEKRADDYILKKYPELVDAWNKSSCRALLAKASNTSSPVSWRNAAEDFLKTSPLSRETYNKMIKFINEAKTSQEYNTLKHTILFTHMVSPQSFRAFEEKEHLNSYTTWQEKLKAEKETQKLKTSLPNEGKALNASKVNESNTMGNEAPSVSPTSLNSPSTQPNISLVSAGNNKNADTLSGVKVPPKTPEQAIKK
jgi:hypothetical protein